MFLFVVIRKTIYLKNLGFEKHCKTGAHRVSLSVLIVFSHIFANCADLCLQYKGKSTANLGFASFLGDLWASNLKGQTLVYFRDLFPRFL